MADRPNHRAARLRRVAVLGTALFAVALAVLLVGPPGDRAYAHAVLVATAPDEGAVLPVPPTAVTLTFGEPVETPFGSIRVYDDRGHRADVGTAGHPAGHADQVSVALRPRLARGSYTVAWRVISDDSHPVSGAFTFSVGARGRTAAIPTTHSDRLVGGLDGLARATAYVGFAGLVGGPAFVLICWPAGAARPRLRRLLWAGWWTLAVGSAAVLLLQGPYGGGLPLSRALSWPVLQGTLGTRLGRALALRCALLGAAAEILAALGASHRVVGPRRRRLLVAGGLVTIGLATTWAAADHAGTGIQVALALPVDVVHLTAMAVWSGGLAALVFTALPLAPLAELRRGVDRFSTVAAVAVAALVGTGAYQAWRGVGTLPALTATAYGRLLLVKALLVATLLAAGAVSRAAVRRSWASVGAYGSAARRSLGRSVLIEVTVVVVVLGVTAALTDAAPARTAYTPTVSARARFDTGGPGGGGSVTVRLRPATLGPNTVQLFVAGPQGRPSPVPEVQAALRLSAAGVGALPVPLQPAGTGRYVATGFVVPMRGRAVLDVTVRTSAGDETTVAMPVRVR